MEEPPGWKRMLIAIWPTIYRMINGTLYFLLSTTKDIVVRSIRQIKEGF